MLTTSGLPYLAPNISTLDGRSLPVCPVREQMRSELTPSPHAFYSYFAGRTPPAPQSFASAASCAGPDQPPPAGPKTWLTAIARPAAAAAPRAHVGRSSFRQGQSFTRTTSLGRRPSSVLGQIRRTAAKQPSSLPRRQLTAGGSKGRSYGHVLSC